ncbi:hypothetical protein CLOAM1162 [Candidatus Cloacimonas acidaminovorans str. Evry]|uniref:Uncharacterized protein n=1 Tax=Cloacimonas acidaminovorans (strain Evry) TaxID=459349 RepID=B0VI48_CLOAI|nr:hypothetical protein CLOAM1162 [Candidatus Cloacimonas acidaminovorans str. Evry]
MNYTSENIFIAQRTNDGCIYFNYN